MQDKITPGLPASLPRVLVHLLVSGTVARIEMLESENNRLKQGKVKKDHFRVEDIQHNDKLVRFYTAL